MKKRVIAAILKNGPQEAVLQVENAKIYLCKYNRVDAEKDIDWTMKFWKKERDAIPTENLNKCQRCEYAKDCRN